MSKSVQIRQAGRAEEKASKRAAGVDAINAERAESKSIDVARNRRRQAGIVAGKAQAQAAASGRALDGTFQDIQEETLTAGEAAAQAALFEGQTEKFNFLARAAAKRFQGQLSRKRSEMEARQSAVSDVSTIGGMAGGGGGKASAGTSTGVGAGTVQSSKRNDPGYSAADTGRFRR